MPGAEINGLYRQASQLMMDPTANLAIVNQRFGARGDTPGLHHVALSGLDTDQRIQVATNNPTPDNVKAVWAVSRQDAVDLSMHNAAFRTAAEQVNDDGMLTASLKVAQGALG